MMFKTPKGANSINDILFNNKGHVSIINIPLLLAKVR